jgi:hypothetical protein
MATGLRTLDLRWPPAREALAKAVPKLMEVGGDQLTERETAVLKLFGEGLSAEDIGSKIGNAFTRKKIPVTRARVNQILHRALQKIFSRQAEKLMRSGMSPEEAWATVEMRYIKVTAGSNNVKKEKGESDA